MAPALAPISNLTGGDCALADAALIANAPVSERIAAYLMVMLRVDDVARRADTTADGSFARHHHIASHETIRL